LLGKFRCARRQSLARHDLANHADGLGLARGELLPAQQKIAAAPNNSWSASRAPTPAGDLRASVASMHFASNTGRWRAPCSTPATRATHLETIRESLAGREKDPISAGLILRNAEFNWDFSFQRQSRYRATKRSPPSRVDRAEVEYRAQL
jgi:hypothetical protein